MTGAAIATALSNTVSCVYLICACLRTGKDSPISLRFRQALRALQKLAEEEETPFDAVELDMFLARYPDACPAVHHSVTYRLAYAPAYRIVARTKLKTYLARLRNAAR